MNIQTALGHIHTAHDESCACHDVHVMTNVLLHNCICTTHGCTIRKMGIKCPKKASRNVDQEMMQWKAYAGVLSQQRLLHFDQTAC